VIVFKLDLVVEIINPSSHGSRFHSLAAESSSDGNVFAGKKHRDRHPQNIF
jgi:hypothetical protein